MATPFTLGNTMRAHDAAVYDWLGTHLVDYNTVSGAARNGVPVLRVFAAPERAFSSIVDLLVRQNWLPGADADAMRTAGENGWPKLPLPVVTIERGEPVADPDAGAVTKVARRIHLNPATGKWESHRYPSAYQVDYRLTFWCAKRYTEVNFREWLYAQLGGLGMTHHEVLLSVTHPAPWGVQRQRIRLAGSADFSALEGEEQRYFRHEYTLTLRMLLFRPPTEAADIVHGIGTSAELIRERHGDTDNSTEAVSSGQPEPDQITANLFYFPVQGARIADAWPRTGAATVAAGAKSPGGTVRTQDHHSLAVRVTAGTDSVELAERLAVNDTAGLAVVGVSFAYLATAQAKLEVAQRAVDGTATMAFEAVLPASKAWRRVHTFALVRGQSHITSIVGAGSASDLTVAEVDLRQVLGGTKVLSQAQQVVGADTVHKWASLDNAPYLVIGVLTPGQTGSAVTVTAQDDITSPAWSPSQAVDPDLNVGFVFLIQPRSGSISVRVPTALGLDSMHVSRYHGPYNGHTI